ncbi:MAG: SDR family oxidoreductase [Chloroflexi bacterium]|nr:SDR family oxidoreductase [Chloroflexota bacterium]
MADSKRLDGRVALITGGGRGIGQAIARAYAAEGAKLALAARTDGELQETAACIRDQYDADVITVLANVTDRAQVENAVAQTMHRYGVIDVMVNNAGNTGQIGPLWTLDPDRWANTIAVHVLGTYYGCRAAIPPMLERGYGRIVNMSGVGGPNDTSYDAAKTAIVNLTENLSVELASTGITVNAISPGSIHTRMWEEVRDMAYDAGDMEMYEKGVQVTSGGGASIERAAELAVMLGSDQCGNLSGRLIRANLDTFEDIPANTDAIMASDAYLLRRVDP